MYQLGTAVMIILRKTKAQKSKLTNHIENIFRNTMINKWSSSLIFQHNISTNYAIFKVSFKLKELKPSFTC